MTFCSHCGGNLAFDGAKFCAHCGKPQTLSAGPVAVAAAARAIEKPKPLEETLFDGPAVTVTTHRLVTPGQTYAIANITSITSTKENNWWGLGFLIVGIGIAMISRTITGYDTEGARHFLQTFGLISGAIGVIMVFTLGATYHLVIRNAGGEVKAFESKDEGLVDDVIVALNQAIARRG